MREILSTQKMIADNVPGWMSTTKDIARKREHWGIKEEA